MTSAFGLAIEGKLSTTTKSIGESLKRAATGAMRDTATPVKTRLRGDVVKGFARGARLSRTWRVDVFPRTQTSADPAIQIASTASDIIRAFSDATVIKARNGKRFLAIPTGDVPKSWQGKPLTPEQVEARFGRRLVFISPSDKGFSTPSFRHAGVAYLVLKRLVVRKATGRWRNASDREIDKGRRGLKDVSNVVMFILLPSVTTRKRIEGVHLLAKITAELPAAYTARFNEYVDAELADL